MHVQIIVHVPSAKRRFFFSSIDRAPLSGEATLFESSPPLLNYMVKHKGNILTQNGPQNQQLSSLYLQKSGKNMIFTGFQVWGHQGCVGGVLFRCPVFQESGREP